MPTSTSKDNDAPPTNSVAAEMSEAATGPLVWQPASNDVLLGRGLPTANFSGNISFRLLCNKKHAKYTATSRHAAKDNIARSIVFQIQRRGGRFLSRYGTRNKEITTSGSEFPWIEVGDDVSTEKVKQTMRDNKRCNTMVNIPSPAVASRPTSPSSYPAAASPQLQQPEHLSFVHPSSHPLLGQQLGNLARASSAAYLVHEGGTAIRETQALARYLMPNADRATVESLQRSLSHPSIPPQQPLAWNPQCFSGHQIVDSTGILDQFRLRQIGGTGHIDFTHGLLSSHFRGHRDQPAQIVELQRAYQDLLSISFNVPLTAADVELLWRVRSLALQLNDAMLVAQVEAIFQTVQGIAGPERLTGCVSTPNNLSGVGSRPELAAVALHGRRMKRNLAETLPLDNRKPAARARGLGGSEGMTHQNRASMMPQRQRQDDNEPPALEKRAQHDGC